VGERNHTETGIVRPDDIVERLRAATRTGDMPLGMSFDCVAVADEIEQLRIAYQQAMNTLEQAVDEIERLRVALSLAVGELSTHGNHRHETPDMLRDQFIEEARRG